MSTTARFDGLDLARFLSFVGMVLVNFRIAMAADADDASLSGVFVGALEGRAAATFVVLAGIGLGLAATRSDSTLSVTLKRAAFLLVIGLMNTLIFEADILHYYAFYFLFGVFCLPLSTGRLIVLVLLLNATSVCMLLVFDYDAGWDWKSFTYSGFWTTGGFVRNLFFNGWHPVVPWLSFLLIGFMFSRLELSKTRVQLRLMLFGFGGIVFSELLSAALVTLVAQQDPELAIVFATGPVPPVPLYILAGSGAAAFVVGACLRISAVPDRTGLVRFVMPAGRQTLTLYIAHIFVGMGALEAAGLLGGQTVGSAIAAALLFCLAAAVYAFFWLRFFKRGPVEALMRKLAG